jgi:hypothetical protein
MSNDRSNDVIEVYDQAAAAYLVYCGVPLVTVRFAPERVLYSFANPNDEAVAALRRWRRGTVLVQARPYREALRTVANVVQKLRPAPVESAVVHGEDAA